MQTTEGAATIPDAALTGLPRSSRIAETGRTGFVIAHRFERDGELLAEAQLKHVWIDLGPPAVPRPLPDWLRAARHAGE